jgi:hypothetical protein
MKRRSLPVGAWASVIALSGAVLLFGGVARAQGTADPGALFDSGLAAMKAEHYETACPALAESYRIDPRVGVLFTLAECEAKWGKAATALGHYKAYLQAYGRMTPDAAMRQGKRPEIAERQVHALEPEVPRLVVTLASGTPAGTTVLCDNVGLEPPQIATPLPLDPGDHVVVAKSPDGSADEQHVTLALRERRTIELRVVSAHVAAISVARREEPQAQDPQAGGGRSPVLVIVPASLGVLGIGAGTATALLAAGQLDTIHRNCTGTACSQTGKDAGDTAKNLANASTIAFGVGIAAAVATVVILLTTPSKRATAW